MAVIVKGEITITKGSDHWKSMVFSQKRKWLEWACTFSCRYREEMILQNFTLLLSLRALLMQAFGADKELTENPQASRCYIRRDFFTNYPNDAALNFERCLSLSHCLKT